MLAIVSDFADQEALTLCLDSFKELTEQRVTVLESTINKRISSDWKNEMDDLQQAQHERSRSIIKEIVEKCAVFRERNLQNFTLAPDDG